MFVHLFQPFGRQTTCCITENRYIGYCWPIRIEVFRADKSPRIYSSQIEPDISLEKKCLKVAGISATVKNHTCHSSYSEA